MWRAPRDNGGRKRLSAVKHQLRGFYTIEWKLFFDFLIKVTRIGNFCNLIREGCDMLPWADMIAANPALATPPSDRVDVRFVDVVDADPDDEEKNNEAGRAEARGIEWHTLGECRHAGKK
jgi:hypothetical protein